MTETPRVESWLAGRAIILAMVAGLATFAGIVLFVGPPLETSSFVEPTPVWLFALSGVSVAVLLALVGVGGLLISSARRRDAGAPLSGAVLAAEFHKFTIVRAALLEGLGFLGCIAFQVAGEGLGLVVAFGCVVGLLGMLPTDGRYRRFEEAVRQSR